MNSFTLLSNEAEEQALAVDVRVDRPHSGRSIGQARRVTMRRAWSFLFITLLAGGCMTPATGQGPSGVTAYTGEVWVLYERTGVVTLRQAGGTIRVQVTPEETRALRLHEIATIRGVLAPPADIERTVIATEAVPVGQVDRVTAPATVRSVSADGVMVVDSAHGPLTVLIVTPVGDRYGPGAPVRLETAVQAMKLVPVGSSRSASPSDPAMASPRAEPGDSMMVTGPILSVETSGTVRIDSHRGPIALWLPNAQRFRVGEFVRVHTFVAMKP